MAIVLRYFITYENYKGTIIEEEFDVDFSKDGVALDEQARRYIIEQVVENGGRVINVEKI